MAKQQHGRGTCPSLRFLRLEIADLERLFSGDVTVDAGIRSLSWHFQGFLPNPHFVDHAVEVSARTFAMTAQD